MFRMNRVSPISYPWNWRAGEVKSVSVEVENSLDDVRVHYFGGIGNWYRQGPNSRILFAANGFDGEVDRRRLDEWHVTLYVDYNLCIRVSGSHLRHSFRARPMVGARERGFSAE